MFFLVVAYVPLFEFKVQCSVVVMFFQLSINLEHLMLCSDHGPLPQVSMSDVQQGIPNKRSDARSLQLPPPGQDVTQVSYMWKGNIIFRLSKTSFTLSKINIRHCYTDFKLSKNNINLCNTGFNLSNTNHKLIKINFRLNKNNFCVCNINLNLSNSSFKQKD